MGVLVVVICLVEIVLISFASYLIFSFINKTPFYPSSLKKLEALKTFKDINLNNYNNFVDIGSGDGRIVRWASKQGFKKVHGIDYNPYLTLYSRLRSISNSKVKIFNKNFYNHEYFEYDIAFLYIFSEHMNKLKEKLFSEMKKGSIIVTNTFKFTDKEPDFVFERFNIYIVK